MFGIVDGHSERKSQAIEFEMISQRTIPPGLSSVSSSSSSPPPASSGFPRRTGTPRHADAVPDPRSFRRLRDPKLYHLIRSHLSAVRAQRTVRVRDASRLPGETGSSRSSAAPTPFGKRNMLILLSSFHNSTTDNSVLAERKPARTRGWNGS